jgi:alanine racemase
VVCGDAVTLWGEGLPAEEIAEWAGTISYEIIIKLTHRVGIVFED